MNLEHTLVNGSDIEQLISRADALPEDSAQRLRSILN